MSTTPSPDRRFVVALTTAVASATLAIGVTSGALLGWIGPRTAEPSSPAAADAGSSQVVYVPITPTAPPSPSIEASTASEPRFAMVEPGSHAEDRDDRRDHDEDDDD